MSPSTKSRPTEQVVRLSLRWIVLALAATIVLGMTGGLLADQLFRPSLPPLTSEGEKLYTTIQEVTISPNTATADMIERVNRSVLLIARGEETTAPPAATSFVVTNDGVVVTASDLAAGTYSAFDQEGRPIPLETIGRDEVFGITFLRIKDNVVVPLDLRQDDSVVGHELILVSRHQQTFQPSIKSFRVAEYLLPAETAAPGRQRLIKGDSVTQTLSLGAPLLDEEGRVAALVIDPAAGLALPVSHVRASLNRVINNQRETNPFSHIGFSPRYTFIRRTPSDPVQFAVQVESVTPGSSASVSGLQAGDIITAIGNTALTWPLVVTTELSRPLPLSLSVTRKDLPQTIVLQPVPVATPRRR